MLYFYWRPSKAIVFTIWISLTIPANATNIIRGDLPSLPVIADFLSHLIKPLLHESGPNYRAGKESFIDAIVNEKVSKLKSYLQDDEMHNEGKNKLKLKGEHDTTIIEVLPDKKKSKKSLRNKKQAFKDDMEKYKKLRYRIKNVLDTETITENTKDLIITTLDDMIARVIGNQCSWKSTDNKALRLNKGKIEPITLANIWTELWKNVRTQIQPSFKSSNEAKAAKSMKFLDHFQEFVTKVINDTETIAKSHRFICQLIETKHEKMIFGDDFKDWTALKKLGDYRKTEFKNKPILRLKNEHMELPNTDENTTCNDFIVCSEEVKKFMVDVYTNINDTAVSTLRNYAEMFIRDVNTDNREEKDMVITKIKKTGNDIEHKTRIIFKKQTDKFTLDNKKNKDVNIKALNNYVKKTINHVKKQIMRDLGINLKMLRPKLLTNINKDIEVNLDVDLGNLERELSTKICMVFSTCNGKYLGRHQRTEEMPSRHVIDKNSVYVKVQLTLNDKKDKKPLRRIGLNVDQAMRSLDNTIRSQMVNTTSNVTRTTHCSTKNPPVMSSAMSTVHDKQISSAKPSL